MTIPLKVVAYATGIALAMATGPVAWAKECKMHIPLRHAHTPTQGGTFRLAMAGNNGVYNVMAPQDRAAMAVRFAYRQRGKPYRWGGTGPYGYDCSGLVQRAWRSAGVYIPRVARSQYRRIRNKVSRSRLRAGDLIFFHGFGHVGMYVGGGRFIHSPRAGQTVRVVRLRGHYARSMVGAVRPGVIHLRHGRIPRRPHAVPRRPDKAAPSPVTPGAPCPDSADVGARLDFPDDELVYCA